MAALAEPRGFAALATALTDLRETFLGLSGDLAHLRRCRQSQEEGCFQQLVRHAAARRLIDDSGVPSPTHLGSPPRAEATTPEPSTPRVAPPPLASERTPPVSEFTPRTPPLAERTPLMSPLSPRTPPFTPRAEELTPRPTEELRLRLGGVMPPLQEFLPALAELTPPLARCKGAEVRSPNAERELREAIGLSPQDALLRVSSPCRASTPTLPAALAAEACLAASAPRAWNTAGRCGGDELDSDTDEEMPELIPTTPVRLAPLALARGATGSTRSVEDSPRELPDGWPERKSAARPLAQPQSGDACSASESEDDSLEFKGAASQQDLNRCWGRGDLQKALRGFAKA